MQSDEKITVYTYAELGKFLQMFSQRKIELLILQGEAGIGKTASIKEAIEEKEHLFLTSHCTPLEFHNLLYENRNKSIVLEDMDKMLKSPIMVSLLKQLCETRQVKEIQYSSTTGRLTVPRSFKTSSNVLISCNKLLARDKNMLALLSRGLHIDFQPTHQELLNKMQEILYKVDVSRLDKKGRDEVYRFVKANAEFADNLNLRHLVRGLQMKEFAEINRNFRWKKHLTKLMDIDERLKEIHRLEMSNLKTDEKIKKFSGSRATYFRLKKKIKQRKGKEVE